MARHKRKVAACTDVPATMLELRRRLPGWRILYDPAGGTICGRPEDGPLDSFPPGGVLVLAREKRVALAGFLAAAKETEEVRARARARQRLSSITSTSTSTRKGTVMAKRKRTGRRKATRKLKRVDCCVVFSDTHIGSALGLCPSDGFGLDDGGAYRPSRLQRKLWAMWEEFWGTWVPKATVGQPFHVVMNGDAIDGVPHQSVAQITGNMEDQVRHAMGVLEPVASYARASGGEYYHVRGTEAHVGKSAQHEEALARQLGAVASEDDQHARYTLWLRIGGSLCHFAHHIGTTGTSHYQSTAVMKELTEAFYHAGRWGDEPPQVVVRSHRHTSLQIRVPARDESALSIVTPAWQLKTPFAYKIPGARQSEPEIGGVLIRRAEHDGELYSRARVWRIERSAEG